MWRAEPSDSNILAINQHVQVIVAEFGRETPVFARLRPVKRWTCQPQGIIRSLAEILTGLWGRGSVHHVCELRCVRSCVGEAQVGVRDVEEFGASSHEPVEGMRSSLRTSLHALTGPRPLQQKELPRKNEWLRCHHRG